MICRRVLYQPRVSAGTRHCSHPGSWPCCRLTLMRAVSSRGRKPLSWPNRDGSRASAGTFHCSHIVYHPPVQAIKPRRKCRPISSTMGSGLRSEPSHIIRLDRYRCLATAHYNYVWRDIIPLLYYGARLVELLHTHLFLPSTSQRHVQLHSYKSPHSMQ